MENKIQKQNSTRIQLELNLGEQLNAGRIKKSVGILFSKYRRFKSYYEY